MKTIEASLGMAGPAPRRDALLRAPILRLVLRACVLSFTIQLAHADPLPGTQPLEESGDLSALMVAGISRYLDRAITNTAAARLEKWQARDVTDPEPMRKLLRERLGMTDSTQREGFRSSQFLSPWPAESDRTAKSLAVHPHANYRAVHVRWSVYEDVWGDGLLLQPFGKTKAIVIAVPDADLDPEQAAGLSPGAGRLRVRLPARPARLHRARAETH